MFLSVAPPWLAAELRIKPSSEMDGSLDYNRQMRVGKALDCGAPGAAALFHVFNNKRAFPSCAVTVAGGTGEPRSGSFKLLNE